MEEAQSVRNGGSFWAAGHDSSNRSSAFSATQMRQLSGQSGLSSSACASGSADLHASDSGGDSAGTEIAAGSSNDGSRVAQGASSAGARGVRPLGSRQQQEPQRLQGQQPGETRGGRRFAGRVYCGYDLRVQPATASRRALRPGLSGSTEAQRSEGGRWKLDKCLRCVPRSSTGLFPSWWLSELSDDCWLSHLRPDTVCCRFATELAGRKTRRRTWDGLGEMSRAGWFDG